MAQRVAQEKMPIFATSPDTYSLPVCGRLVHQRQRGFTLIELLVVLAIGAMLVGVVPMAFNKLHEGSQYRDALRNIVTQLRQAQQLAVSQGQPIVFHVNLDARQYGIQGSAPISFPAMLEVKTTTGSSNDPSTSPQANFVFLPEGGSTGGTIELVRTSGAGARIRVDWLFGRVTQEPRTP